jgi:signal transduction histidine kinase
MTPDVREILRHLLQVLAFCCVVAVFTTLVWPEGGYARQLVYSLCIGCLTWTVIEFGRLLTPRRFCHADAESGAHGWPKGWRGILLTAAGIAVGFSGGTRLAAWLLGDVHSPQHDMRMALVVTIAAGTVASLYFHARGRQAALQAAIAAAERDAAQARLTLLQSQLEPHMLFNTLANLRALIGADPPAAQFLVDRLNDYLRATLGASRSTAHPLAAEFDRLRDYLALMAIRMGPRLAYGLALPEALRDLPVPPLLLQPLVENAIRHGLEPRVPGGRINVVAAQHGDMLRLEVADTGAGFDAGQAEPRPGGFGLAQVRERVATAYGGRGRVSITSSPGAGTRVVLELPLAPPLPQIQDIRSHDPA